VTLIASFNYDSVPVLIGDVLVSARDDPSERSVELPSIGDSRQRVDRQAISLWLNQKVHLVNPHLAAAFSGDIEAGRCAIHTLRRVAGRDRLSRDALSAALSAIRTDSRCERASLVGLASVFDDVVTFGIRAAGPREPIPRYNNVFVAGGGSDDFLSDIRDAAQRPDIWIDGPADFRALSRANALLSRYIAREIHAGAQDPLRLVYGGGWEIAYVASDKTIQKVGDTTVFFWSAAVDGGSVALGALNLILKRHYIRTRLVLRWLRGTASTQWSTAHIDQRCVSVPALDGDAEIPLSIASMWPDYSSRVNFHVIVVQESGRPSRIYMHTNDNRIDADDRVTFVEDSDSTVVTVPDIVRMRLTQLANMA
jgi:hypothetical protein